MESSIRATGGQVATIIMNELLKNKGTDQKLNKSPHQILIQESTPINTVFAKPTFVTIPNGYTLTPEVSALF